MNTRMILPFAVLLTSLALALAQQPLRRPQKNPMMEYPPKMTGAKADLYKTVGGAKLNIYIFTPEGHKPGNKRPAIVFFFGGGWTSGSPGQFAQQCEYFASRGMVAMTADYRVASRHQVKAVECVKDAKFAIRWVRAGAPPAIIFHGRADTTVPYASAEAFAEAMKKAGNRCDLVGFDGQPHGFFNFGRNGNKYFIETVRKADQFLASLGYLKGEPTIDEFVKSLK